MFDAERFKARLAEQGMSQSELARRIGVSQQTIARLASGAAYGSRYLQRIAHELATTASYLAGETDDPTENAPPPPPPSTVQMVMMPVALPAEAALQEMFEGLLESLPKQYEAAKQLKAGLAHELAMLLPIGLGAIRGPLIYRPAAVSETTQSPLGNADDGRPLQRRA